MMPLWWTYLLLGIIEGLTEFLPVSSTGHLIVAGHAMGFKGEFAKTFEISIQLGAILAVVVYFRSRLTDLIIRFPRDPDARSVFTGIAIAFLPAAVVGLLTHKFIKTYLFNPTTVGMALMGGGIAILIIEAYHKQERVRALEAVKPKTAFWVGVAQCFALFPGVSRAGATIMGGLLAGMDRKTAAEFSFFLALPTMFAATLFDAYKNRDLLGEDHFMAMAIGLLAAFLTAWLVIAFFLNFIKRHTFRVFGYYRILFGILVLLIFWQAK